MAIIALAIGATNARAEWMRAETGHFIVYSDQKEATVRTLATDLELFDSLLRWFHGTAEQEGASSNKLTVFVADDVAAVQRLCGRCPNVYGFYVGRASGSVAFTPRTALVESRADLRPRAVLNHEYAHHFLFGNYTGAYPAWFSEGYAEFTSTFFRAGGKLTFGRAAVHRAQGLFSQGGLSAAALFDPPKRALTAEEHESIYGRGWLLTHWLMFDPQRRAKFDSYLRAMNSGTPSAEAAVAAFGKMRDLDRALDDYMRSPRMTAMVLPEDKLPAPQVALRALTPGEAAMIDLRMASTRGVTDKTAKPLLARAAPIAARYPNDAVVHGWLAEMAFDAGQLDAADAAADRALAADPKSAQALLYKGLIGLRRAEEAKAPAAAWAAARRFVVAANKLDPDNAMPLFVFYNSFGQEGRPPSANAVKGLLRAQELAPQDEGLRTTAVAQLIRDGELARAKFLLKPLAYNPHAGADNPAAKLLAALDGDKAAALAALEATQKGSAKPE